MNEAQLYSLQRLSAVIMAPLVVVHLITIMYAVRGGLSAEEILARTSGASAGIVVCGVVGGAVWGEDPGGERKMLIEWAGVKRRLAGWIAVMLGGIVFITGMRAVIAVSGVMA